MKFINIFTAALILVSTAWDIKDKVKDAKKQKKSPPGRV